jgi:predicted dehydrogenase
MKVALLGLSHPHSALLLATLEHLPEITGICLWDADTDAPKRLSGSSRKVCLVSTDLDKVLSEPLLTFAVLCVHHDESAALAMRVMAAGKHLVSEKPVGISSAEIARVQCAAAAARVVASVLYVRRCHPVPRAARGLERAGNLGALLTVEGRFLTTQVKFRDPNSWLFRRRQAGGGILLWLGCHCLDLMHYITGDEISEVGAFLATRSGEGIDVEDLATLTLKFRSGAIGTFHAGYTLAYSGAGYANSAGYDSYLGFNHRSGRVVWPDLNPHLLIESPPVRGGSPSREETFPLPTSPAYGGMPGEVFFREFISAVRGESEPPATMADAVRTARILEAAEMSAAQRRIVSVAVT